MRNSRRKGSITVFLALSLSGVMLITFLLLDMARLHGTKKKADVIADIAAMSVFADYNRYLWDNYRILAVDASYGSGGSADFAVMESRMGEYLLKNGMSPDVYGTDLLRLTTEQCSVEKYGLITDQKGLAFLKQAALQQKCEIPLMAIDTIVDRNEQVKNDSESNETIEDLMDAGRNAMQEPNCINADEQEDMQVAYPAGDTNENPIEEVGAWMNNSILSQVLPSTARISDQRIDISGAVSKRTLACGNYGSIDGLSAAEKALFAEYEKSHFSNYRNDLGHDGLKYEWEYVLCGKNSDKKNLTAAIKRLLALRETENLGSLVSDSYKMTQAMSLATGIAGWTGNPAIVEAVKLGLVAAWAYMESVLDVRLLLTGGRVALVKSPAEWTTNNLLELTEFFDVSRKAKECRNGIDYEGYLLTMSALQTAGTLGLRSLDILENSLKRQPDYQNAAMDQMVVRASFSFELRSEPAFFSLFALSSESFPVSVINIKKEMSYLDRDSG